MHVVSGFSRTAASIRGPREDVIAEALAAAKTPCVTSSFQAEDVVLVHLLLKAKPDIPVLFLETFHHFPQTLDLPRRDRGEVESEPDQPEGARAIGRPVADEHRRLLRAPQGGTAVRRARGVRHLVHRAAARPVAVTRQPAARRAVHAEERQGADARSARWRSGRGRMSGSTRRRTTFRCCRSTSLAIRASAASPAPRCRSIRRTRGRAAGRARSSNAAFTSSRRNRGLWASGSGLRALGAMTLPCPSGARASRASPMVHPISAIVKPTTTDEADHFSPPCAANRSPNPS